MSTFNTFNRNEVFDDSILKYRAVRADNFSFESNTDRINRVTNFLCRTLTQSLSEDSFVGKLETFLTCRAVAEKFQIKIGNHSAEEIALTLIYRTMIEPLEYAEVQMLLKALPEILSRPFPICKEICDLIQTKILPPFCDSLKSGDTSVHGAEIWKTHLNWLYVQRLLSLIKL